MIKRYFKVTLFTIGRGKNNTARNVTGLAIGIAVCMIVSMDICFSQYSGNINAADFTTKAKNYLRERVRINNFSGAVLVALDGKPVLKEAYGFANYEFDRVNTTETKFRIGSISKQFTAAAILLLEQKGQLGVNDFVNKYLTNWPQNWAAAKIHHLLSHTSGLPALSYPSAMVDVGGLNWYKASSPKTIKDLYKPGEENQLLDFKPGEKFAYSNIGYIILGMIVEKVSGKPYSEFMEEEVFSPLGMSSTDCEDPNNIIKQRANGYNFVNDTLYNAGYVDMRLPAGAGAICSTVDDMLKWNNALQTGKFLSMNEAKKMFSPNLSDYGYGWWIQKKFNQTIQWHRGTVSGFVGFNAYYPQKKLSIIILSNINRMQVKAMATEIAAIVFGENYELPRAHKETKVDETNLSKYLGKYAKAGQNDEIFFIEYEGRKMMIKGPNDSYKFEIFPEANDMFFAKWGEYYLSFKKSEKGTITNVLIRNEGELTSWVKQN